MTLIKQRLKLSPKLVAGGTGQFDVIADGVTVASRGGNWLTRKFGKGYPDLERVVDRLEQLLAATAPSGAEAKSD